MAQGVATEAVRISLNKETTMKPPFEIYSDGIHIGDQEGHVCTAENSEIARELVHALNVYYTPAPKPGVRPLNITIEDTTLA
jgi:hypothetical protein